LGVPIESYVVAGSVQRRSTRYGNFLKCRRLAVECSGAVGRAVVPYRGLVGRRERIRFARECCANRMLSLKSVGTQV